MYLGVQVSFLLYACTSKHMNKTTASVITQQDSVTTEEALFTYSEEERQQNDINRETAKLVFSPKFIPVNPRLLQAGVSANAAIIYGFIDFYLSSSSNRFYFTNEQLMQMLGFTDDKVKRAMKELKDRELIVVNHRIRANGGKVRFIALPKTRPEGGNTPVRKVQIPTINYNKINDNTNTTNGNFSDEKISSVKDTNFFLPDKEDLTTSNLSLLSKHSINSFPHELPLGNSITNGLPIETAIEYFFLKYNAITTWDHPPLTPDATTTVIKRLAEFDEEHELTIEDWQRMIDKYFSINFKYPNFRHNLLHFSSPTILTHRFEEVVM